MSALLIVMAARRFAPTQWDLFGVAAIQDTA